jgi:hypothetical protein
VPGMIKIRIIGIFIEGFHLPHFRIKKITVN